MHDRPEINLLLPDEAIVKTRRSTLVSELQGEIRGRESGAARRTFSGRAARLAVGGALTCAAVIAALAIFNGGSSGGGTQSAFAAAAIRVAKANPRLLITAPGWWVKHGYGFEEGNGELVFVNERHQKVELDWYPAREYRSRLRYRVEDSNAVVKSTLLGNQTTTVGHTTDGSNYATVLAPQGQVFVELRATKAQAKPLSRSQYDEVLRSLRPFGVNAWLSALPPELVLRRARETEFAQMLRGVPLPPDFDPSTLPSSAFIAIPYVRGTKVTGAVACSWLERWTAAKHSGDSAAINEAVAAMNTVRRWPILLRMAHEGGWKGETLPKHGNGWASKLMEVSRAMRRGDAVLGQPGLKNVGPKTYAYRTGFANELGCQPG
jgi:hypothetical protein